MYARLSCLCACVDVDWGWDTLQCIVYSKPLYTTQTTQHNYTTLHYATLDFTPLHSTPLHHTTPHHTTPFIPLDGISPNYTKLDCAAQPLHYTTLHTISHYSTLHYTVLHYTTVHYTVLHDTTLHDTTLYITLHYTTLHCTLHYTKLHAPLYQSTPHLSALSRLLLTPNRGLTHKFLMIFKIKGPVLCEIWQQWIILASHNILYPVSTKELLSLSAPVTGLSLHLCHDFLPSLELEKFKFEVQVLEGNMNTNQT